MESLVKSRVSAGEPARPQASAGETHEGAVEPDAVSGDGQASQDAGQVSQVSRAEQAYQAIRDMLVTLRIRPGAPINEEQLIRQLGLGRTPVREAVKRLEVERLVTIYPRRGTFSADVNITDLALISEIRIQLEPHAAFRAAERATPADRLVLDGLLKDVRARDGLGSDALMRLDIRAHRAVYACTHNSYLEATLTQYHNLATRIWYLVVDRMAAVTDHIGEHDALLTAVIAREPARARELSAAHIASFERAVRSVL